jgi:hypothetical protein
VSAQKQVFWIAAGRIVTVVAYEHTIWDRPTQKLVGHPMGDLIFPEAGPNPYRYTSIAKRTSLLCPNPTTARFFLYPA